MYTKPISELEPLIIDLDNLLDKEIFISAAFKRWLNVKKIKIEFDEIVEAIKQKKKIIITDPAFHCNGRDEWDAIIELCNRNYDKSKRAKDLFDFICDLLKFYKDEKGGVSDVSEIKEDFRSIGLFEAYLYDLDKYVKDKNNTPADIETVKPQKNEQNMNKPQELEHDKKPMLFISHSSKDYDYVKSLVSFLKEIGFTQQNLFCSSVAGYGIVIDDDIFGTLQSLYHDYKLYMIIVHSPRYYESPVSLNEMGAAWGFKTECTSFLTPDMNYNQMKGVINDSKICIDFNSRDVATRLIQLKKKLVEFFDLPTPNEEIFESAKNEFIAKVGKIKEQLDASKNAVDTDVLSSEAKEVNEESVQPIPVQIFKGDPELLCEACGNNLLSGKPHGHYIVFNEVDSNRVTDLAVACVEHDRYVTMMHEEKGQKDSGWEDIDDLCIPTIWIQRFMAFLNSIQHEHNMSDEAFEKMKKVFLNTYPFVARELTQKEKWRVNSLMMLPDYI